MIIKIMLNKKSTEHSAPLYNRLNIDSFYHSYIIAIIKSITNSKIQLPPMKLNNYNTRQSHICYHPNILKYRTGHSPFYIASKIFNKLPEPVRKVFLVNLKRFEIESLNFVRGCNIKEIRDLIR